MRSYLRLLVVMLIWLPELIESYTVGGQILISENTCKDANFDIQIAG
ncbi:hypothetical protein [Nostoc flagelliforme]